VSTKRIKDYVRLVEGMQVEVRSEDEIAATLDGSGVLDGLPFMPEMSKYCGRRFTVSARVRKILVEGVGYRVMKDCVLLDGVFCDGKMHGGCQRMCNVFWKHDWIKPVQITTQQETISHCITARKGMIRSPSSSCQSTSLKEAASKRSFSVEEFLQLSLCNKRLRKYWVIKKLGDAVLFSVLYFKRLFHRQEKLVISGPRNVTPLKELRLKNGELIRTKTRDEIIATLDKTGKNRGLAFTPEMIRYCGNNYRVFKRIDNLIDEATGLRHDISGTVILENVRCDGNYHSNCPRNCYLLWREIWLDRV
jgi:hypothetical protein